MTYPTPRSKRELRAALERARDATEAVISQRNAAWHERNGLRAANIELGCLLATVTQERDQAVKERDDAYERGFVDAQTERNELHERRVKKLTEERDQLKAALCTAEDRIKRATEQRIVRLTEERDRADQRIQALLEDITRLTEERDAARAEVAFRTDTARDAHGLRAVATKERDAAYIEIDQLKADIANRDRLRIKEKDALCAKLAEQSRLLALAERHRDEAYRLGKKHGIELHPPVEVGEHADCYQVTVTEFDPSHRAARLTVVSDEGSASFGVDWYGDQPPAGPTW